MSCLFLPEQDVNYGDILTGKVKQLIYRLVNAIVVCNILPGPGQADKHSMV